jgi:hypothetical protein
MECEIPTELSTDIVLWRVPKSWKRIIELVIVRCNSPTD